VYSNIHIAPLTTVKRVKRVAFLACVECPVAMKIPQLTPYVVAFNPGGVIPGFAFLAHLRGATLATA
jgi:hypothetical protein